MAITFGELNTISQGTAFKLLCVPEKQLIIFVSGQSENCKRGSRKCGTLAAFLDILL